MTISIPSPLNLGSKHQFTIGHLIHNKQEHEKNDSGHCSADRYACGYPIPSFQRDLVWTPEQEERFIQSIWLGLPLGTYCVHRSDWFSDGTAKPMSGWLLDGQQRLTTLERYFNDEFPVYGGGYSELKASDRRRFSLVVFPVNEVALWDEAKAKEIYNLMAFGGTAHKPSEYAR